MLGKFIQYKCGYKYVLAETYRVITSLVIPVDINTPYIRLSISGALAIQKGFAWDGASWAIDTKNFMRGSLVHDALYQLMRAGLLDSGCRVQADEILRDICREDGMSAIRAWWVYVGLRFGGGPAADPANETPVLTAP